MSIPLRQSTDFFSPANRAIDLEHLYLDTLSTGSVTEILQLIRKIDSGTPLWVFQKLASVNNQRFHVALMKQSFSKEFMASDSFQEIWLTIAGWKNPYMLIELIAWSALKTETKLAMVDIVGAPDENGIQDATALITVAGYTSTRFVLERIYTLTTNFEILCYVARNPNCSPELLKQLLNHNSMSVRVTAANNHQTNIADLVEAIIKDPGYYRDVVWKVGTDANAHKFLTRMLTAWNMLDEGMEIPVEVLTLYVKKFCVDDGERLADEGVLFA